MDLHKILHEGWGHVTDVLNCAIFYVNGIEGLDSGGWSNFWLSHRKEKSPLTQGLNYCSACDNVAVKLYNNQLYLSKNSDSIINNLNN